MNQSAIGILNNLLYTQIRLLLFQLIDRIFIQSDSDFVIFLLFNSQLDAIDNTVI